MTAPTLTEALRALGYTHRDCERHGCREILDADGRPVAALTANEGWEWVREHIQGCLDAIEAKREYLVRTGGGEAGDRSPIRRLEQRARELRELATGSASPPATVEPRP